MTTPRAPSGISALLGECREAPVVGCRHALEIVVLSSLLAWMAERCALAAEGNERPAQLHFNQGMLRGGANLDISAFNEGNRLLAGRYRAEIYVNQVWKGRTDVNLRAIAGEPKNVQPCMDRALLEMAGVDLMRLSAGADALLQDAARCVTLPELVPDSLATFDGGEQRLDLSLPQAAMLRAARGYVDPRSWDDGVTAARLSYNANLYRSDSSVFSSTQVYVGLNAGFNVGPWRLLHIGSYSKSTSAGTGAASSYQDVQTSLQRAIEPIKSQLLMGDAFTDGSMFDSVGFRGVQLATDDRMIPESQRGYAPMIRGIASSNARVQVQQNGNILYETTVSPGAFVINDLYPTGYGGDLDVIVTEADGSVHVSKVPYAAAVNAVRAGATYYSMAAGLYRNANGGSKPWLMQGTIKHGFSNLLTGYGGVTAAEGYLAALGGVAVNTSWGAIGVDLTEAMTKLPAGPTQQGQSLRLSYSKVMPEFGTSIAVSAYRYSSQGYYTLQDAMALRDPSVTNPQNLNSMLANPAFRQGALSPNDFVLNPLFAGLRSRSRLQLTLNQPLPQGYGSFYFSGSSQTYWNRSGHDTLFEFGYNNTYKLFSYGVSASREYEITSGRLDNRFMVMISVPLGIGAHAPYTTASVQKDSFGTLSMQDTVTGTLGANNEFSYSVNAGRAQGGDTPTTNNLGASANYVTPVANVSVSGSRGNGYTQAGFNASGGLVAYSGGVAVTPSPGVTEAIIEASDAAGARVVNGIGLRIDPWGHAIVSGLTPFARNQVEIDPKGLPLAVELKSTTLQTAPTAGAIVRLKFETENAGRAAMLRLALPDGRPIPFGAEVSDEKGLALGTVAQGGRVLVRGLPAASGSVLAKWGSRRDESCRADYALPATPPQANGRLFIVDARCQPADAAPHEADAPR